MAVMPKYTIKTEKSDGKAKQANNPIIKNEKRKDGNFRLSINSGRENVQL